MTILTKISHRSKQFHLFVRLTIKTTKNINNKNTNRYEEIYLQRMSMGL